MDDPWLEPFYSWSQVCGLLGQRPLQYLFVPQMPVQEELVLRELAPGNWSNGLGSSVGVVSVPEDMLTDGPCWRSESRHIGGGCVIGRPASLVPGACLAQETLQPEVRDTFSALVSVVRSSVSKQLYAR